MAEKNSLSVTKRPSGERASRHEHKYLNYLNQRQQLPSEFKSSDLDIIKTPNLTKISEYRMGKMLGQGAYAMVREALHLETGYTVAIKIYDKYKLQQMTQIKRSVVREIKLLAAMTQLNDGHGHQNIMRLFDAIDGHRQLYLVTERCHGDMLSEVMKKQAIGGMRKNLPEADCAKIAYQLASAMAFYHELCIAHRDIKLENILVDTSRPDMPTKLIDFGFATQSRSNNDKLSTFCGTPAYMAPELCNRDEYLGPQADSWALGIVLYTILFGAQPFKARTEKDLFIKIKKGQLAFPKREAEPSV